MTRWVLWVLIGLAPTGCESEADQCKKACYGKVAECESLTDEAKKAKCEADLTEEAIACANSCAK